ncbi:MAG: hypothetical protein IIA17_09400 [candidate division Zixibacteria bacterium]|nr:hypothetical protein [candidate division Zixibacteria bacterium]
MRNFRLPMRARLIQKDINNPDFKGFLKDVSPESTDIVCFGELATSGCLYSERQVPALDELVKSFNGLDYSIMIGCPKSGDEGLQNCYMYYDSGEYQLYHKINLFGPMNEDKVYTPGTKPGIFDTKFGKIGAAICYDLRFPEIFEDLKAAGAEIIFVPAAFPRVRIQDWKDLLVQRARDNKIKVVGINAVGNDGTYEFGGSSMVVDAQGKVLEQADETTETVIEVKL